MKTIFVYLITLVLGATTALGQLTLTRSNYQFVAGDVQKTKPCDSTVALPRNTGPNQTWDFSSISEYSTVLTVSYEPSSSVPGTSVFPGANLVGDDGSGSYSVFASSASPTTQLEFLGTVDTGTFPITLKFGNSMIQAVWPISYGSTFSDSFSGNFSGSLTGTITGTSSYTATGAGNLILPSAGTFFNVLQVKTSQNVLIKFSSPDTYSSTARVISYAYYHSSLKFPILTVTYEFDTDSTGTTLSFDMEADNAIILGLNERNFDATFSIRPNPASDYFQIDLTNRAEQLGKVQICSMTGALVREVNLGNESSLHHRVDISDLAPGIYTVKTILGDRVSVRKLVVGRE